MTTSPESTSCACAPDPSPPARAGIPLSALKTALAAAPSLPLTVL